MKDEMKRTSCKGPLYDYLGHFKEQKYLNQGHNDSGKVRLDMDKTKAFEMGFKQALGQDSDENEDSKARLAELKKIKKPNS